MVHSIDIQKLGVREYLGIAAETPLDIQLFPGQDFMSVTVRTTIPGVVWRAIVERLVAEDTAAERERIKREITAIVYDPDNDGNVANEITAYIMGSKTP